MKKHIILLHGAIGSAHEVKPLIPLIPAEFEAHALHFPGHGGSDMPVEPFSIPLFAQSVLNFLDQQKIQKTSFFGYSMGGYVSLHIASHYPERVEKVFTLGTKLDWNVPFAEEQRALLNPEKIAAKVPAFAKTLEEIHYPNDWKQVLEKTAEMLLNLGAHPPLNPEVFSSIKIPVTIGLGDSDRMVTEEESKNVVDLLKNGRFLKFEATPHPIEKVNHKLLAEHITRFFGND